LVGPAKYYSQKEEESMNRSLSGSNKEISHHQQNDDLYFEWPSYPDNKLLLILEKDNEIRDWFSKWIEGLRDYQKETLEEMSSFYNKIYPE